MVGWIPFGVFVFLAAVRVDALLHISMLPADCDTSGGYGKIGTGAHDVGRKHSQSAGVSGHFTFEADFHCEVGDFEVLRHVYYLHCVIIQFFVAKVYVLGGF